MDRPTPKLDHQAIGKRIKTLRKRPGFRITQAQLAAKMKIARTTLVAIEQGKRRLRLYEATHLVNLFHMPLDYILYGKGEIVKTMSIEGFHINLGSRVEEREKDEECLFCEGKPTLVAHTYFGAAVCEKCWDTQWRQGDGVDDPPFKKLDVYLPGT